MYFIGFIMGIFKDSVLNYKKKLDPSIFYSKELFRYERKFEWSDIMGWKE